MSLELILLPSKKKKLGMANFGAWSAVITARYVLVSKSNKRTTPTSIIVARSIMQSSPPQSYHKCSYILDRQLNAFPCSAWVAPRNNRRFNLDFFLRCDPHANEIRPPGGIGAPYGVPLNSLTSIKSSQFCTIRV